MTLFNRDRIYGSGLSLVELAVLGIAAAVVYLLSTYMYSAVRGDMFWANGKDWEIKREFIGMIVGVPFFGTLAYRLIGFSGYFVAIPFAVAGGGAMSVLVIEVLIRKIV